MVNIIKKNTLVFSPPNSYWMKKAKKICKNEEFNLFINSNEYLWKIKHFQLYEELFKSLNGYDNLLFLGTLIRPEIFFSELENYFEKKRIKIQYMTWNGKEILNDYIKNFVIKNKKYIFPIEYKNFLFFLESLEEQKIINNL